LRRRLVSAERFKDNAIRRGLLCLKILASRESALLRRVTSPDQRGPFGPRFISAPSLEKLHGALMALRRCKGSKRSQISAFPSAWIALARIKPVLAGFQFPYHGSCSYEFNRGAGPGSCALSF
jgi:hypothetical protein